MESESESLEEEEVFWFLGLEPKWKIDLDSFVLEAFLKLERRSLNDIPGESLPSVVFGRGFSFMRDERDMDMEWGGMMGYFILMILIWMEIIINVGMDVDIEERLRVVYKELGMSGMSGMNGVGCLREVDGVVVGGFEFTCEYMC